MISTQASAASKIILFGEHAVVYGHPAVAIPVQDVRANAAVSIDFSIGTPVIEANDFKIRISLDEPTVPDSITHLIKAIQLFNDKVAKLPKSGWRLTLWSKIPIGRGLGSSAATAIAVLRALLKAMNKILLPKELIDLSFELEKIHHGTPSGIDNTVISLEKPVLFRKDRQPASIKPSSPVYFVVGDTGISKKTAEVVAQVAAARNNNIEQYDRIFNQIGQLALEGSRAVKDGDAKKLGHLMNENQSLLDKINVSSPELDKLIKAAVSCGAIGAKLCGAGKGGCIVAVSRDFESSKIIARQLMKARAENSFITRLK
jgi:mevalonate kinase